MPDNGCSSALEQSVALRDQPLSQRRAPFGEVALPGDVLRHQVRADQGREPEGGLVKVHQPCRQVATAPRVRSVRRTAGTAYRSNPIGRTEMDERERNTEHAAGQDDGARQRMMYLRFAAMIVTSTAVMYALTYTNLFSFSHARVSVERAYMAVLMGAAMAIVMLGFMWGSMYKNLKVNIAIIAAAVVVGGAAFMMSQTQTLVGDDAYMKGMIPHHSIAILTSERADIDDLRVRELADGISQTQVEEISEMEWLLDDIAENGKARTPDEAAARPVPDFADEAQQWLRDPLFRLLVWPSEHEVR